MAKDNKKIELEVKKEDEEGKTVIKEKKSEGTEVSNTASISKKPEEPVVYEDYDSTEIAEKPKKKFKKRYIVIGAAVVAVAALVFNNINAAKNAVVYVNTQEAALGTVENIVSVSGTVQSAETKSYFSNVSAPISEVNVKVGDKVSAGDVLFTYDQEAIELAQQTAELAIKQAKGSYGANFSATGEADRKYAEGMTAQQINDRLDAITAEIDALNDKIKEKTNRLNQTLSDLNKVLLDYNENGISDEAEGYIATERKDSDGKEMYLQTQQAKLTISNQLNGNDEEINAWNNQITALKEEQSHLSSAKAAQLNGSQLSSAKAQLDSTTINQEDTISKLEEAKDGVKADFNGIVTEVSVVEGATVQAGSKMITIANSDDVEVSVQISKSDLSKISIGQDVDITVNNKEYTGEITKISGTANKNNNGVAVVDTIIKIEDADSDIILGVEASNKIHAQKAENTLVLPYEYVQTDSEGDFVYVVEDGLVVRKDVTVGIASSTQAQILDGINVGDRVITGNYDTLVVGMPVAVAE